MPYVLKHLEQWLARSEGSLNVSCHYSHPLKPWLFFSIPLVPMEGRSCLQCPLKFKVKMAFLIVLQTPQCWHP